MTVGHLCDYLVLDRMVVRQKPRFGLVFGFWLLLASGFWHSSPALALEPGKRTESMTSSLSESLQGDVYIIGPGDELGLYFLDAPELSGPLKVLNDGSVSLPMVGSVVVSGLTLQQASSWMRELFSDQLLRPELQLKVHAARPIRVSVVGAVERPGLYSLSTLEATQVQGAPTNNVSGLPTLVDAIQKAGGITSAG